MRKSGGAYAATHFRGYDPTRELYRDLNADFAARYLKSTGQHVRIVQSHGGSSRQGRLSASGELKPDVVTLGLPSDVEVLHKRGLIADGWASRLLSRPYYSTNVFVVRRDNPHAIRDWPDLLAAGIEVITPDPKTSGNGKLTALAAWGSVVLRGGSEADATRYLQALYKHAPFLVVAARDATTAFAVERIGDVHLSWENEAPREVAESHGDLAVIYPPVSILAEPAVAWVDTNTANLVHASRPVSNSKTRRALLPDRSIARIYRHGAPLYIRSNGPELVGALPRRRCKTARSAKLPSFQGILKSEAYGDESLEQDG